MIDRLRMHAFDETKFVRDLRRVRQKIAHPRAALPMLFEWLNWPKHELALCVAGHRAETFPRQISFGNRGPMQFLQLRFVIEQIDMRRRAIHEKVNHTLRLRREMRTDRLRETVATQQ